jgi:plasmid stabilization system protein ParE
MKVRILREAKNDLIDGFRFYERQEQGAGDYFLSNLESDIESLALLGGIHPKPHGDFHRCLSKRFPFLIYYSLSGEIVLIRAVVDCRRKPAWIRSKISKLERNDGKSSSDEETI